MDLFNLQATLGLDSKEFEKGLDNAESKGSNFGAKLGSGLKKAGQVAAGAMAAIGTGAVAVGTAFVDNLNKTAEYGDEIDKVSQKMGISAEEYQKLAYAAELSGTSIDQLQKAQKKLFEKNPDLPLIDALNQCAEAEDKTAAATELFGAKVAMELTPMLNQGADGIQAMMQEAEDFGMVISDDAVKASATFEDSLTKLQGTVKGLTNTFMADFLPAASDVMNGLSLIFSGKEGGEEKISQGIDQIITNLTNALPKIETVATTLIKSLGNSITTNLPKIATTAVEIVKTLATTLINNLPTLISTAGQIITTIAQALPELVKTLVQALPDIIDAIVEFFNTNFPVILDAAVQLFVAILEAIPVLLDSLITNLPSIIDTILNALDTAVPQLIEASVQLLTSIIEALPKVLPKIVSMIVQITSKINTTLIDNLPLLIEAAIKLLWGIITAIPEIIDGLIKELPNIWNTIKGEFDKRNQAMLDTSKKLFNKIPDGIKEKISDITQQVGAIWTAIKEKIESWWSGIKTLGKNLIAGLIAGITDKITDVKQTVDGLCSDIWNGITGFFGIHSPSKEMKWIGEMLNKGFAEGIEDSAASVIKQAQEVSEGVAEAASAEIEFDTSFGGIENIPNRIELSLGDLEALRGDKEITVVMEMDKKVFGQVVFNAYNDEKFYLGEEVKAI